MDIIVEDIPAQDKPVQDKSPLAQAKEDTVSHLAIARRFGIDQPTKEEQGKLQEIWAYASQNARSENISDIVYEVIHLEGVIGSPRLGESRLDKLYRYTKLRRQESMIQDQLKEVTL